MPRTAREASPARADSGIPSSPSRPRRNLKRTASQAMPPTPPRTVKRERKRRIGKRTISRAAKSQSPRLSGSGPETELEGLEEREEEDVTLGSVVGRRLEFGPTAKRRRKQDLDARLETLLESLDGEDAENPFWDGPSKIRASEAKGKAEKSDVKKSADKSEGSKDGEDAEKIVRIRSPSPPLLSFHAKAPFSPPPSNRRKKKTRGRVFEEEVVESKVETILEVQEETGSTTQEETVIESKEETVIKLKEETVIESKEETSIETQAEKTAEPTLELTEELSTKPIIEPPCDSIHEPAVEPTDELPAVDLPPMPSTPKKGKKRMDSPIRDSPNNPFLEGSPSSITGEPAEPRTPTAHAEKPTITYVFRGVRAQFANPMYNLPPEAHERSLLPLEHPDYSPDPACPPRRLFTTKSRRRQASPSPTRHGRSNEARASASSTGPGTGWDDSDDEAELHVTPPRRLFH